MPIEAPHNLIPSQPDRWKEEPGKRGGERGKENRMWVPFGNRIGTVHSYPGLHHPDCLDLFIADVLRCTGGVVRGLRG